LNISELIEKLQQCDPDTEIIIQTYDGDYRPLFEMDIQYGWLKGNTFYSDFDVDDLEKDTSTMKRVMMV
jgi:hypothetical protein